MLPLEQESIKNVSLGIVSSLKISINCLWRSYFLIKVQDYCQQPKFLLNSITDVFLRVSWKSWTKRFRNYPKITYVMEVPFDKFVRTQSAGYRTRNSTSDIFWKYLERKGYLKISKRQNFVQNYPFFFNVPSLQFPISDFNNIRLKEKYFQ